jgi:hypothetical protein
MEVIRLLIVACEMLSQSTSMADVKLLDFGGNWITVVHVNPEHPKHAQWLTGLVNMQASEEQTFSASRNCVQIFATWGRALSC